MQAERDCTFAWVPCSLKSPKARAPILKPDVDCDSADTLASRVGMALGLGSECCSVDSLVKYLSSLTSHSWLVFDGVEAIGDNKAGALFGEDGLIFQILCDRECPYVHVRAHCGNMFIPPLFFNHSIFPHT